MIYGRMSSPEGSVYVGEYQNNTFHGTGTLFLKDGSKFKGDFVNGKRHGAGEYVYRYVCMYVCTYACMLVQNNIDDIFISPPMASSMFHIMLLKIHSHIKA